jgi:hypothetical protein
MKRNWYHVYCASFKSTAVAEGLITISKLHDNIMPEVREYFVKFFPEGTKAADICIKSFSFVGRTIAANNLDSGKKDMLWYLCSVGWLLPPLGVF